MLVGLWGRREGGGGGAGERGRDVETRGGRRREPVDPNGVLNPPIHRCAAQGVGVFFFGLPSLFNILTRFSSSLVGG